MPMAIFFYDARLDPNPTYQKVTRTGLTMSDDIRPGDKVIDGTESYRVVQVLPTLRYRRALLEPDN